MLELITLARSWHLLVRIGIATIVVAAATALQLPTEIAIPSKPFLFYFSVVAVLASVLGRIPGYVAVVETCIASALYFEPVYSVQVTRVIDWIGIQVYAVLAAVTVFAFCRLVDNALAEKSDAYIARIQLQDAQARLAAIVTSSFEAVLSKTTDGLITSWNQGAERLFGYSEDEIIGQPMRCLIPEDRLEEEERILAAISRGEYFGNYDTVRVAKGGRLVEVAVTVSPLRGAGGRIIGASKMAHDITGRKLTERRLAE